MFKRFVEYVAPVRMDGGQVTPAPPPAPPPPPPPDEPPKPDKPND